VRRRRAGRAGKVADGFWPWWAGARDAVASGIEGGGIPDALVSELSARVAAVHPDLEWELTPGTSSRHTLVVSAAGVAELRPAAYRWLLGAPPPDEVWEYADARSASWDDDGGMVFADVEVPLGQTTVTVTPGHLGRLDVTLHHPAFAALGDHRQQVKYLLLDWLVGEDAVEQWIGAIEADDALRRGARPACELPDLLAAHVAEQPEDGWALLSGGSPEQPVIASVRSPQPRFKDLLREHHLAVRVPYVTANPGGLPVEGSLDALRALEEVLEPVVERTQGVLVGHETAACERLFHVYCRAPEVLEEALQPTLRAWPEGRVAVHAVHDPGWQAVAHLR
jgi:hypothetical protein